MSEKYLDPPEPVWQAECEICGAKRDCGDMQEVEDDVWVCDLKGTDCLNEWNKQKVEEE